MPKSDNQSNGTRYSKRHLSSLVLPVVASDHYRGDVDGLRAVAVLLVLGFHAFPAAIRGGFIGVDIFFVISGFLISGIIFSSLERKRFSFVEFYARRIRRIFPALVVVLLFSMAFGWLLLFPDEYRQLGKHILGSGLYANNFVLWMESGYFDSAASQKPLLHLWSLGIEEQFYLTYPLIVWAMWRRRLKIAVLLALCIGSFVLNVLAVSHQATAAFYSPATRAWELLLGCLLAYWFMRLPSGISSVSAVQIGRWLTISGDQLANFLSFAGVTLIAVALVVISQDTAWPGYLALLPTLGAAFILAAGSRSWINNRILSHPACVSIGLISYPLYLWHWVLLSFAEILKSGEVGVAVRCGLALLSMVLAAATYQFVELPIRKEGQLFPKALALGLSMTAVAFAGLGLYVGKGLPFRFAPAVQELYRDAERFARPTERANCPRVFASSNPRFGYCRATRQQAPTHVVWGDSHGDALFAGITQRDETRAWLLLGDFSCPPLAGVKVFDDNPNCDAINAEILAYLQNTASIKTVVLTFFGSFVETDNYAADHVDRHLGPAQVELKVPGSPNLDKVQSFAIGLGNVVAALEAHAKHVVIVFDNPELPFFPKSCFARPIVAARDCRLARTAVDKREQRARMVVSAVVRQHQKVLLFDQTPIFCDRETCSPFREGVMMYADSHHLSRRGSALVASLLLNALTGQLDNSGPVRKTEPDFVRGDLNQGG